MTTITCKHCGNVIETKRKTRKFCSQSCANRSLWASEKSRECRHCGKPFPLKSAADANRQHCSQRCAKAHNAKAIKDWKKSNPEYMPAYQKARAAKHPGMWLEKAKAERLQIIELLGRKCLVCGVSNPNWLHVDFIPTTRNCLYRHPRHLKYIRDNAKDFRILCANHHYELTLTGKIQGTNITQSKEVMPNA